MGRSASAKATTDLANAQNNAVSTAAGLRQRRPHLARTTRQTFQQKLKASAGRIGLHTQAQRDSFGAANIYIGDLARQATAAISSGHGTDAAITAIRDGLPALRLRQDEEQGSTGKKSRTLNNYLHKLELIKFISTPIHVTGTGKWSVTGTTITPGLAHGPQNIGAAPGGFADGGRVPFSTGIPGKDSVLVMTKPGEIFVPPEKGPMLAPALQRPGSPGSRRAAWPGPTGRGTCPGCPGGRAGGSTRRSARSRSRPRRRC